MAWVLDTYSMMVASGPWRGDGKPVSLADPLPRGSDGPGHHERAAENSCDLRTTLKNAHRRAGFGNVGFHAPGC